MATKGRARPRPTLRVGCFEWDLALELKLELELELENVNSDVDP